MRDLPFAAMLVLLGACAPAQSALTSPNARELVRVQEDGTGTLYEFDRTSNNRVSSHALAAPAQRLWPLLLEIYPEMGLPITAMSPEHQLLASESGAKRGRKVAGSSLVRFLECGRSPTGGPVAVSAPVSLTVKTLLHTRGDSTTVQTAVVAWAQDPIHNNPAANCSSTGRLEAEIAKRLDARLGSREP